MLWFHFFPVPTQCLPLQDILPLMIQRLDVFLCGYCSNTILCLSYIAFGIEPKLEIWFILFPPSVFPSVFNLPSTGEWPFPLPVVFVWIDLIQTSLHTHTHISSLCFTFSVPAGAKLSKKMSSPGCSVGGGVPCQAAVWVCGSGEFLCWCWGSLVAPPKVRAPLFLSGHWISVQSSWESFLYLCSWEWNLQYSHILWLCVCVCGCVCVFVRRCVPVFW